MRKGGFLKNCEQRLAIGQLRCALLLPDTARPDGLVQTSIDSHVSGAHFLFGKLANDLDGARRALLESNCMEALVQVDGALASDHLVDR